MKIKIGAILIFCLFCLTFSGCQSGGDLPKDKEQAKVEAKAAIKSWVKLLNEGKGTEFLQASLPELLLKDKEVVGPSGAFTESFMEKFYKVLPKLHYALQEALIINPVVRKGNVEFLFSEQMPSGALFNNRTLFLSKTGKKWHFNGPLAKEELK